MPHLVQFGAGNIGRGFIGPVFAASGWQITFIDVNPQVIEALQSRGSYTVYEVDNDQRRACVVDGVAAIDGRDISAVASSVAQADLLATAVGLGALRFLGPGLAAGFLKRKESQAGPLDILVCENGVEAPDLLAETIDAHVSDSLGDWRQLHGLVRTSIGRMVPAANGEECLDISVEPYAVLPVERAAFRGPVPQSVAGLQAKDDFDLVLRQKLYLHNGTHACLAYSGLLRGLHAVPDVMEHTDVVASVRAAGYEVSQALSRLHGRDAAHAEQIAAECHALLEELFHRYRNRPLGDPLSRVARDPVRKLSPDDRLIGAARRCQEAGIPPLALAQHIHNACAYRISDDEPQAEAWRTAQTQGWQHLLQQFSYLDPQEPLMTTLDLAAQQRQAAERIRSSGIHLKDDEVSQIEIADFGLGRFDELGLAIYVYVNTDRCCAKELAMVPGQICPEHRHPSVDGEPGKEETFRCRSGEVHLFLPGHKKESGEKEFALSLLPVDKHDSVTVFKHVHLLPGDQYTLKPNTPHWFVAGSQGAVISEFSTRSMDEADIFTDAAIQRVPDAE